MGPLYIAFGHPCTLLDQRAEGHYYRPWVHLSPDLKVDVEAAPRTAVSLRM